MSAPSCEPPISRRVVKFGGSLLVQPSIFARLDRWLTAQPPAANVIVVGGGGAVDWWRELDRQHDLDVELAHQLAIRSMSDNGRLVAHQLERAIWVESLDDERLRPGPCVAVIDVTALLQELEHTATRPPLPRCWSVSGDSVAGWIAEVWGADELVLLKSCDPPPRREDWGSAEYVDPQFATLQPAERVRCVNLARLDHASGRDTPGLDG